MAKMLVENTIQTSKSLVQLREDLRATSNRETPLDQIADRIEGIINQHVQLQDQIDSTWSSQFLLYFNYVYKKEKGQQPDLGSNDALLFTKSFEPLIRYIMDRNKKMKIKEAMQASGGPRLDLNFGEKHYASAGSLQEPGQVVEKAD